MTNFFPNEDYKLPVSSNYMRFLEGENTFRVLSSAIVGWEYWTTDNKPVRSQEPPEGIPDNIKYEKDGKYRINHFWAFVVWNYEARKIQILQLTQKSIMEVIEGLVKNPKWGHPQGYDITITRSGSGFDTKYSTIPNPKEPIDDFILSENEEMKINLDALYANGDPFAN